MYRNIESKLRERVNSYEASWQDLYNQRINLLIHKPKIASRYDEERIKGHWRGYGDVFREEMAEKATQVAQVIHARLLSLWAYQAQAGEGEFRGQLDKEFFEIVKHLGVNYDPAKQKPTVADLQKAINKNLQTLTKEVSNA